MVTWQYDNFVMSFTNAVMPNADFPFHGTYFFGPRGMLMVGTKLLVADSLNDLIRSISLQ